MKLFYAIMLVVIAVLLAVVAYQVDRATWTEEDRACWSPLETAIEEETCHLGRQNADWDRRHGIVRPDK